MPKAMMIPATTTVIIVSINVKPLARFIGAPPSGWILPLLVSARTVPDWSANFHLGKGVACGRGTASPSGAR